MKKTILSFLCIGSACMVMAQQNRPISDPNMNRTNTTTNSAPQQNNLNNNMLQANPVNSGTGVVNGHNTMMNETRNYPGNTDINNISPNSTLNNGDAVPLNNMNTSGTVTAARSTAYSITVPSSVQTSFQIAYPAAAGITWQQSGDWYRARYMENGKIMESSYREDGKSFTRMSSPQLRTYVPEEIVNQAMTTYGVNLYAIALTKGNEGQDVYSVTVIENGESRTEWMNGDGSTVMSPYRTEKDEAGMTSTQQAITTEPTPASVTIENTNNAVPALPVDDQDIPVERVEQQSITEQSSEPEAIDADNSLNRDAINNATTSDSLIRRMDEEQMKSPESEINSDIRLGNEIEGELPENY